MAQSQTVQWDGDVSLPVAVVLASAEWLWAHEAAAGEPLHDVTESDDDGGDGDGRGVRGDDGRVR